MIDYIGSKSKLLDWIFKTIAQHSGSLDGKRFLDGCAGTGSASFKARELGAKVVSNDLLHFSPIYISGYSNLSESKLPAVADVLAKLNSLQPAEGFFYNNYSVSAGRMYFTDLNAGLIDAVRDFIDIQEDTEIKNYLIACLLESVSRVSNTAGTHGAFLKSIKDRALAKLEVRLESIKPGKNKVEVFNLDLLDLLKLGKEFDIFYLDPPYTSRQYAPNYHLYETLVKNDSPTIHGKTGLRNWQEEADSNFCRDRKVRDFFKQVCTTANSKDLYISYSSDGLLSKEELLEILKTCRPLSTCWVEEYKYTRYKADLNRAYNDTDLYEYLFISI